MNQPEVDSQNETKKEEVVGSSMRNYRPSVVTSSVGSPTNPGSLGSRTCGQEDKLDAV